ncbi:MAG: right-handed parallel beta-helix repeat-containing protein [Verrucomicrobiales bacterium]|nr:right-handed parallel beta-helix repeat-containing protein [Verrucomicrobiales bacterium]
MKRRAPAAGLPVLLGFMLGGWVATVRAADIAVAAADEPSLLAALASARSSPGPDRVLLPPGTIRLSQTIVISRADGGLVIESADPMQPCWISGATLLDRDAWSRPAGESRPIWQARLPAGWPVPRALFADGKMLVRARSRGFVPRATPPESMPYAFRRAIDGRHVYLPGEAVSLIGDPVGAELRVIPRFPWTQYLLPVSRLDREHGLVWSAVPGLYPMTPPAFGHFPDGSLWIENTAAALDEPGEWRYDPAFGSIFVWMPDGGEPGARVAVPRLTELLRIEGEADPSDLEDRPVKGVSLRHLIFTEANAYGWEADKTGWGLQHDWEMYDRPTAMVRLRFAEGCRIEQCRFLQSGAAGVRLDLHARDNVVTRSEFADLGGVGVLLAGYGMGYKDVNRGNEISHNLIRRIGRVWWHSPGIFAWQSGHNRIIHNRIHHTPYSGIVVSGRTQLSVSGDKESSLTARWEEVSYHLETRGRTWHDREELMHGRHNEVAWNDIHHVMETLADGNAIYVSGTGAGNRVHRNFIHDIAGANMNAAIRCDDDQHEVSISHNVIARVNGEGILWKGRCDVTNNVIFALRSRTAAGDRTTHQRGFFVLSGEPVTGSVVRHNVLVSMEPRYPILFEYDRPWNKQGRLMEPTMLSTCEADRNLYWNPGNPAWADAFFATQRARGIERESRFADPRLRDPKGNDFTFPPDSPAAALGIEPVDVSVVGPGR